MNNVPKSFFEVFPALKLEGILEGLCQQIQVEKVTSNKMGNRIKVYIVSKKLVQKEQLFCLEKNIKEQLFPRSNVNIVIVERFELSEAYTPKNLFDAYEESILEEFKADTDAKLTGILLDEGECFDFSLKKFADKVYRTSELLKDEIVDDIILDRL